MKSGLVNLNNIMEDPKGKSGNTRNNENKYENILKKNDSDLWDI